jgi:RNA polymerase sigma factor (sigma-70 family)
VQAIRPPETSPYHARNVADRDSLERSFRKLTPEQRAVVVLHHHFGYPLTEIASVLGIPEGTARSRLHYAVRILRAELDGEARLPLASEERSA